MENDFQKGNSFSNEFIQVMIYLYIACKTTERKQAIFWLNTLFNSAIKDCKRALYPSIEQYCGFDIRNPQTAPEAHHVAI